MASPVEVSWTTVLLALLPAVITGITRPSGRICRMYPSSSVYLRIFPVLSALDALSSLLIISSWAVYKQYRCSLLFAFRGRFDGTDWGSWRWQEKLVIPRCLFFLVATLPQFVKLLTFPGVLWAKAIATCFVLSFLVAETLFACRVMQIPDFEADVEACKVSTDAAKLKENDASKPDRVFGNFFKYIELSARELSQPASSPPEPSTNRGPFVPECKGAHPRCYISMRISSAAYHIWIPAFFFQAMQISWHFHVLVHPYLHILASSLCKYSIVFTPMVVLSMVDSMVTVFLALIALLLGCNILIVRLSRYFNFELRASIDAMNPVLGAMCELVRLAVLTAPFILLYGPVIKPIYDWYLGFLDSTRGVCTTTSVGMVEWSIFTVYLLYVCLYIRALYRHNHPVEKTADGKATDGEAADGEAADGKTSEEEAADDKGPDKRATDGTTADGKAVDGKAAYVNVHDEAFAGREEGGRIDGGRDIEGETLEDKDEDLGLSVSVQSPVLPHTS